MSNDVEVRRPLPVRRSFAAASPGTADRPSCIGIEVLHVRRGCWAEEVEMGRRSQGLAPRNAGSRYNLDVPLYCLEEKDVALGAFREAV